MGKNKNLPKNSKFVRGKTRICQKNSKFWGKNKNMPKYIKFLGKTRICQKVANF